MPTKRFLVQRSLFRYHLYAVVGPLTKYFDTLTNVYIRLNRKRIKGDSSEEEQLHSLTALGRVLVLITRLMSPFTPFFCDYVWQNLRKVTGDKEESVHFTLLPTPDESLIDHTVERRVEAMRSVIDLVRVLREKAGIPVKVFVFPFLCLTSCFQYPLKEMIVINRDSQFLADVESLDHYILSELNVRKLTISQDKDKYGVSLKADINFRALGARLKGDQKKVAEYLKQKTTQADLEKFLSEGKLEVCGHEIGLEDMAVSYSVGANTGGTDGYKAHSDSKVTLFLACSVQYLFRLSFFWILVRMNL